MNIKGGKAVPRGYKALFFTDRKHFVVCHIHKVEQVVKNGNGKKRVVLAEYPVSVGVSRVNEDRGDKFDRVANEDSGQLFYSTAPGLGKHIALQRAIENMGVHAHNGDWLRVFGWSGATPTGGP